MKYTSQIVYFCSWFGDNPPHGLPKDFGYSVDEVEVAFLLTILDRFATYPRYRIGIGFIDVNPKAKLERTEEQLAQTRRKRLHTKLKKTAPLFAEEFEQRIVEERKEYYSGAKNKELEKLRAEMNRNPFSDTMTASEAIKWLISKPIPEPDPAQLEILEEFTRKRELFKENMKNFEARRAQIQCAIDARKKAALDIRNEPLFRNV